MNATHALTSPCPQARRDAVDTAPIAASVAGGLARIGAAPWSSVELVVFDVDGTLYDQAALRRLMLRELLTDALARRSTRTIQLLRRYRRLRETLAEAETPDFETVLRRRVADASRVGLDAVGATVETWMHRRPLRHLSRCAVPGIADAFAAIRRSGRRIGVLSDYPADDKLAALGLEADIVVSADDPAVGRLKPHPAGLQRVLQLAGVRPEAALMVGDRAERDGEAAHRAGVACLLRSARPQPGYSCFADYRGLPFTDVPSLAGAR